MIPLWLAWSAVVAGALGMAFAVWSAQRRNLGHKMHSDAAKADQGLFVSGGVLIMLGLLGVSGLI